MYERIELAIEDLLLDHENPRLGSVTSQSEALRELVELNPRHFRTMMESIRDHGLDPGDLFYVIDEAGSGGVDGYTVVDGNRRLAALKVLLEPALLVGAQLPESTIKMLSRAREGFDPAAIDHDRLCVLFHSREEADEWILRRHGRGQEGEARIGWSPLEIQRFQGDRTVLDIIDFVARNSRMPPERWAEIRSKLERSSFVLRRFLESAAGRSALGLGEIKDSGGDIIPTVRRNPDYVLGVLLRIFEDIAADRINTRKYNKATQIKEYFDELPDELKWPHDRPEIEPKPFHDVNVGRPPEPKPEPPSGSAAPTKSRPTKLRDTLAPRQLEFKQPVNAKGQQLVREATRVRLKDMPLSAAFLLRGFVQFAVDTYMTANGLSFWENEKQLELRVRADRVIDHLITNKRAKRMDLEGIRRRLAASAKADPASIQALNDYHHDRFQVPSPDALRSGWDEATALFVAVFGRP